MPHLRFGHSALLSFTLSLGGCAGSAPTQHTPAPPARGISPAPRADKPPSVPVAEVALLEVQNPSAFERAKAPIVAKFIDLGLTGTDDRIPALAAVCAGATLPSQALDVDADGEKDALLVLVDFNAAETKTIRIVLDAQRAAEQFPKLTQAELSAKTGGEWKPRKDKPELKEYVGGTFKNVQALTPPPEHTDHSWFIRYEGPGIESDKVGYRIYLDRRNGFDIFGKKVAKPALQNVGQDGFDSYHQMADWGMDILKVGESLGAGGFGFWDGKRVKLVSEVAGWDAKIIENGSLYSSFRIDYKGWRLENTSPTITADFSVVGGSRAVNVKLKASTDIKNFAIGVVKHPGTELLEGPVNVTGTAYTYLASWGKQSLYNDMLGLAILFQKGALASHEDDGKNYAAVLKPEANGAEYYFLAAWEGEPGGVKTREDFLASLTQEAERLTITPRIRLKSTLSNQSKTFPISADAALSWAKKLADSELQRKTLNYRYGGWDANRKRKPRFEYDVVGLQPHAYGELNRVAPEPRYDNVIAEVTGSYVTDAGDIREYDPSEFNIDSVAPARNLLGLYEKTKQEKYKRALTKVRQQLAQHPKTSEGAFWHKKKYPHQLWLDGVYMGLPFLAGYSAMFENGKSYDEVVNEFVVTRRRLRNQETGLYFHAWDEKKKQDWADPKTGLSKHYWGRGLGWFAMAVLDVLDVIPTNDEKRRQPLLEITDELASALVKYQDPETGTWWQILDQPKSPGNYRESTASAMFTYFYAKATRKKYIPDTYAPIAVRAFEGLVKEFITVHADGKVNMTHQCLVGGLGFGRDGSFRYYMTEPVAENDPKGNGPFILAGVEIYRLLKGG